MLVAQSLGGFTAPLVCERVPVELLVLVNAMVPRPGETGHEWWTATGWEAEVGEVDVVESFFHDVPADVREAALAEEPPQSATPFDTPWPLPSWPEVPTRFLVRTHTSVCLHMPFVEAAMRAIAEPRRRAILRLVRDEERSAGEIASHFEVTRPAVSQHLSVLKEAGLVSERRNGTERLYRARPRASSSYGSFSTSCGVHAWRRSSERQSERRRKSMTSTAETSQPCSASSRSTPARRPSGSSSSIRRRQSAGWERRSRSMSGRVVMYHCDVVPGHTPGPRAEFVEIDPPRRLVFTWGWEKRGDATCSSVVCARRVDHRDRARARRRGDTSPSLLRIAIAPPAESPCSGTLPRLGPSSRVCRPRSQEAAAIPGAITWLDGEM